MRVGSAWVAAMVCGLGLCAVAVRAQQGTGAANQGAQPAKAVRVVVLDTYGIWRFHCQLAPPVLASGEAVTLPFAWLNYKTPGPAQNWMANDFDDRTWNRGPVGVACKTALLARVCLRGKFTVTEPGAVKGLALSATYRGGLIIYVNGKEAEREHIAAGQAVADGPAAEERKLTEWAVPANLLRKGMNVIGLEVVRAPYPQKTEGDKYEENSCEIVRVRMTSSGEEGVIPNAVRPEGLQVWNVNVMAPDINPDFGDGAEALRPVTIMGARNGMFSGKVVVGSTKAIRGLKVTPGELKGEGGVIASSNVHIRYGMLWGVQGVVEPNRLQTKKQRASPYPTYATNLLGALWDEPLNEYRVMLPDRGPWGGWQATLPNDPGQVKVVNGAVAPIWITVKVPADAKAGKYTGTVKIEVRGEKPVDAAVELRVADYALPNTQDYCTWVDMVECPDTLALEYNVPLWSEKHFALIARSFQLIGQTGSRTLYIPLIAHTHLGEEQSMVRWIKKGDRYEYDFSVMEKYLDTAEKNMGKPKLLVFDVWDLYMLSREYGVHEKGPNVTALDPATGKTEIAVLPTLVEVEASRVLWAPLFAQLREHLRKRGLESAMMLGIHSDIHATAEDMAFFREVAGDVPWVIQSHEGVPEGRLMYGKYRVGYQGRMWPTRFSDDGAWVGERDKTVESMRGWNRPDLITEFNRSNLDRFSSSWMRYYAEASITGAQRGVGRLGADFWLVLKSKNGERMGRAFERYPESDWKNLCIDSAFLAPGPDGPVATNRMEAFREGVQECEAHIVIERALSDVALRGRLGEDLAGRCEKYLHARHMMMWLTMSSLELFYWGDKTAPEKYGRYDARDWRGGGLAGHNWYLGSGWQERTAELYELAGEVAMKVGAK